MATKLKNLKIKKVDFVDNGANPGASIALYKSKPAEGEEPAAEPQEGATPPEESVLKRIFRAIAKSIGATDAQADAAAEEVSKSAEVPTFGDAVARRRLGRTTDEIWEYCYALNDSLCSIVRNTEITVEDKKALMSQSCAEFAAACEEAIPKWSGGAPVKLEKAAPAPLTPDRIENAKAARDRLNELIAKSEPEAKPEDTPPAEENPAGQTPPADPQREEPVQKGAFDMEIDKSKLSAEEVAQLEAIEKKAGIPAKATPAVPAGVEKSAPATPADNATGGEEDIYKGIHPDVAKEIAELRKFRQDAENRELLTVAKKYELLGKKPEELVPVLKSLKAAGGTAYNDMIGVLDANLEAVQKSGAFSELGKCGGTHGEVMGSAGDAWSQIEKKAEEIRKSAPAMSYYEAIDTACRQNPDLVHDYENGR